MGERVKPKRRKRLAVTVTRDTKDDCHWIDFPGDEGIGPICGRRWRAVGGPRLKPGESRDVWLRVVTTPRKGKR